MSDPSALTSQAVKDATAGIRTLLEAQIDGLRQELEAFRDGHEEKHISVVNAAIQHRKELSDASVAIVKAQVDAQFESQQTQLRNLAVELKAQFASSDLRYQQRYDAQTDALQAAFQAQQEATAAALSAAKEAVTTALTASEKAVAKAEVATEKLIPRAEVEARLLDITTKSDTDALVVDRRLAALTGTVTPLSGLPEALAGLDRVTDAKFITFRTLIDSQADKVALALAASNKAVDAAFASSAAAISKAEVFNEKRFDIMTKQIDELKTYRDTTGGKGEGANTFWGYLVGGIGLLLAISSALLSFSR